MAAHFVIPVPPPPVHRATLTPISIVRDPAAVSASTMRLTPPPPMTTSPPPIAVATDSMVVHISLAPLAPSPPTPLVIPLVVTFSPVLSTPVVPLLLETEAAPITESAPASTQQEFESTSPEILIAQIISDLADRALQDADTDH